MFNPKKSTTLPNIMELDRFIAEVGYDNIKQILANAERYGTRYTVLYEMVWTRCPRISSAQDVARSSNPLTPLANIAACKTFINF